jgi:Ca2+-transporting ATPase
MGGTPSASKAPWHALEADAAVAAVEANRAGGLASDEAARRLERFGPNALPEARRRSLALLFFGQFKSPLIYLLLVAAVIAALLGEITDAVVVLVVVLLNACIGAFQEGRAERAVEALRRLSEHKATVLRGGREEVIEARAVVPGDILVLSGGDAVAADARVIELAALEAAEAALTGESVPVRKTNDALDAATPLADRLNMVYAGTYVTAGRGRAVVVGTGVDTEVGRVAAMTDAAEQPKTPLERRIDTFGRMVIVVAVVVFGAIIGIGLLRGLAFSQIFMVAVSSLVGMVPEGLPVAMTIALAIGVQRMARRNAVVRRLSAVETLGSTTVICSDKTGTLTRNEMTVTELHLADGREVSVAGVGYAPTGQLTIGGLSAEVDSDVVLRRALEACVLCNDAQLDQTNSGWTSVGDPTEIALLTVAAKGGVLPSELRARLPRQAELPFDPAQKMMAAQYDSTATQYASADGPFVVIKGAPEAVLALCNTLEHAQGVVPLDARARARVQAAASAMAARSLRVLAVAIAWKTSLEPREGFKPLEGRATLVGLVGQFDPPRTEVARAVEACRQAGIRPVVVTGDHKATGVAVARQLGIYREGDSAVDGVELDTLDAAQLDARLETISVFARVHPAQKLRIVEAYQQRHHVVAMTGDGVNDAPALVRADVGVAMGLTGTEVAKDAAKIVIADDNFATIVSAVEEGRVVYNNIKKAVLLLFSTSAAEVAVLLIAMLLGYPPLFAAVQILWNNLVTEGAITVNLVMEPAEGDEMRSRPIAPDEPLITRTLLVRMAVMVPSIIAVTLGWFIVRTNAGVPTAQVQTETFTLLALCEWFNALNCRSERKSALTMSLFKNRWLLGGLAIGNVLQLIVVFWRPVGDVLRTTPFGFKEFVLLGVVASVVLWTEEARKLAVRLRERRAVAA